MTKPANPRTAQPSATATTTTVAARTPSGPQPIGAIVRSLGHDEHYARLSAPHETRTGTAAPAEYGQFVRIEHDSQTSLVGIVTGVLSVDTSAGKYNPLFQKESPFAELFTNELDERTTFARLTPIGKLVPAGPDHAFPKEAPRLGSSVYLLTDTEIRAFHTVNGGGARMAYYENLFQSQSVPKPVLQTILHRLRAYFPKAHGILDALLQETTYRRWQH